MLDSPLNAINHGQQSTHTLVGYHIKDFVLRTLFLIIALGHVVLDELLQVPDLVA